MAIKQSKSIWYTEKLNPSAQNGMYDMTDM